VIEKLLHSRHWIRGDWISAATPAEDVPITALWPRSRDLAPKVRVVVDALVKAFMPAHLNAS
jgi:DNA-binding transcriptional LysR family regulator